MSFMRPDMPNMGTEGKHKMCPTGPLTHFAPVGHIRAVENTVAYYRKRAGLSQTELAERVGTTLNMMGKLERGDRTLDTSWLEKIGGALKVEPYLLLAPIDIVEGAALPANDDDIVEIDSVDLAYGFGGAFLDGDAEVEKIKVSQAWLQRFTNAPPSRLGIAEGIGDSMEPLFSDRDLVVFDRSALLNDHMSDKTWVFTFGQVGMVKRLRPLPDGTIKIMSANRSYPDEIAAPGEIHIIGRVVASIRRH